MANGAYKQWSKQEREASYKLTVQARKLGWTKPQNKCQRCAQDKGIIQLHNEDYDVTAKIYGEALKRTPPSITEEEKAKADAVLFVWCWRCHMMHHSFSRNPEAVKKYFKEVDEDGLTYPPVFKHDFRVLNVDHAV